eukprot:GHVN01085036.1.p1 GENE.GHVN01085036.1~~GHVN01085036.1.p1  ORF type:complete len:464 (+),score=91.98 GHVN01085036.1:419-1810(+)
MPNIFNKCGDGCCQPKDDSADTIMPPLDGVMASGEEGSSDTLRWQSGSSDVPVMRPLSVLSGLTERSYHSQSTSRWALTGQTVDESEVDQSSFDPSLNSKAIILMTLDEEMGVAATYSGKGIKLFNRVELPESISTLFDIERVGADRHLIMTVDSNINFDGEWCLKKTPFLEAEELREDMLRIVSFTPDLLTFDELPFIEEMMTSPRPDRPTFTPWRETHLTEEEWKRTRISEARKRVSQLFKFFVADLFTGIFLSQLHFKRVISNTGQPVSMENCSPLHCKLLDDLSTMVLDQHSGKLVLLPLEDVKNVETIFRNVPPRQALSRSAIDSTAHSISTDPLTLSTPSSESVEINAINEEYVMTISMKGNKLAFVFVDRLQAARYSTCFKILVHFARHHAAYRKRGALSTMANLLSEESVLSCSDRQRDRGDEDKNSIGGDTAGHGQTRLVAPVAARPHIPHSNR